MALVDDIVTRLERHFNVLIYGPPGTGKTYIMQQVVQRFRNAGAHYDDGEILIDTASEHVPLVTGSVSKVKVGWVTFHQSYSYEEFVIGLRPDPQSQKLLTLEPSPGLLLDLAEFARQPGHVALLIIDEINRGNVSRIFGEFITLLEVDKRLDEDGNATDTTVAVNLPYIKPPKDATVDVDGTPAPVNNPFTMPRRLYTLASMNSVDKSIAPLDSALRRRFHVVELAPRPAAMAEVLGVDPAVLEHRVLPVAPLDAPDLRALALLLMQELNRGIALFLGPEFCLGDWYLAELRPTGGDDAASVADSLCSIWNFSLFPQLAELFHGRSEQLAAILRLGDAPAGAPVILEGLDAEDLLELGAVPFLRRVDVGSEATLAFLRLVAGVASAPDDGDAAATPS